LILLDELAAGTDPGEGIGLSIAVLEELAAKKATIIATTHFNEIKTFASQTAGFENARMEFDLETLQPLYLLTIGEAGKSYALHIAARLGIHSAVIERAKILAGIRQNDRSGINTNVDKPSNDSEHTIENEPLGAPSIKPVPGATSIHSGSQMEGQQSEEALRSNGGPTIDDSTAATGKVWEVGDRVFIPYLKRAGVIYRTPDEMGNLVIIVQKEKLQINIKRIKPYIDRKHLYPDGYDMDIVFESKENRKKRKQMSKHHMEGMTIEIVHEENERGKSK
ncbi:MAG: DNA mismatch repair protein MutS, partial [Gorillibacterium sp.]|nr:DNA mismatch repair protein MutS [Gorillibacterium sp.]